MLLIGAGGLGSPAALYLAAAGVGRLGIVDDDVVDESNLQRQVLHSTARLGEPKAESAKRTLDRAEPGRRGGHDPGAAHLGQRRRHPRPGLGRDRRRRGQLPHPLPVNDASVWHGIPVVHGSIYRFEGQTTVFKPARGPLLSLPVPATAAARAGAELRRGRRPRRAPGRDRLAAGERGAQARARRRRLARRPAAPLRRARDARSRRSRSVAILQCPVCGDDPTITEYIDYVEFCAAR